MTNLIENLLKKEEGVDLDFKEKLDINNKEQKAELSKDVSSMELCVVVVDCQYLLATSIAYLLE